MGNNQAISNRDVLDRGSGRCNGPKARSIFGELQVIVIRFKVGVVVREDNGEVVIKV